MTPAWTPTFSSPLPASMKRKSRGCPRHWKAKRWDDLLSCLPMHGVARRAGRLGGRGVSAGGADWYMDRSVFRYHTWSGTDGVASGLRRHPEPLQPSGRVDVGICLGGTVVDGDL